MIVQKLWQNWTELNDLCHDNVISMFVPTSRWRWWTKWLYKITISSHLLCFIFIIKLHINFTLLLLYCPFSSLLLSKALLCFSSPLLCFSPLQSFSSLLQSFTFLSFLFFLLFSYWYWCSSSYYFTWSSFLFSLFML